MCLCQHSGEISSKTSATLYILLVIGLEAFFWIKFIFPEFTTYLNTLESLSFQNKGESKEKEESR